MKTALTGKKRVARAPRKSTAAAQLEASPAKDRVAGKSGAPATGKARKAAPDAASSAREYPNAVYEDGRS